MFFGGLRGKMKISTKLCLSVILLASIILGGCANVGEIGVSELEVTIPTEIFVQGFVADDSKSLKEILTQAYSLEELRDFFGEIPPSESMGYRLLDRTAEDFDSIRDGISTGEDVVQIDPAFDVVFHIPAMFIPYLHDRTIQQKTVRSNPA